MKTNSFLFAVCCMCQFVFASNLNWRYEICDGGIEITGVGEATGDVHVPDTIDGYLVKKIRTSVFSERNITSIVIPDEVVEIGSSAFYGCSNLTSVTLPRKLKRIQWGTFSQCIRLASVQIPESVKSIEAYAFNNCVGLKELQIPNGVTSIENYAFYNCSGLLDVAIPLGAGEIDGSVFGGCSNITSVTIPSCYFISSVFPDVYASIKSITIPFGITYIGNSVYQGCSRLSSLSIPESVTVIRRRAFYGCKSLSNLEIPISVTNIDAGAFSECGPLSTVTIPSTFALSSVFPDFYRLIKTVIIPDGVEVVCRGAFSGCNSLESITIPQSVTNIMQRAFSYCRNLTTVDIPSKVIGDYAFSDCSNLSSVNFSGDISEIGAWAFSYCSLRSVALPVSVQKIGDYAFANCPITSVVGNPFVSLHDLFPNMQNFTFTNNVTKIANNAFAGAIELNKISIPSSVIEIGDNAFKECKSLLSVRIPPTVKTIPTNSFSMCYKIRDVETPLTDRMYRLFPNSYTNLQTIVISEVADGVIVPYAFSGCRSLTSVSLPNDVNKIGSYAFNNCQSLGEIELPAALIEIGYSAFSSCVSLRNISLPENVKSVGWECFYGCRSLEEVSLNTNIVEIGRNAFTYCSRLEKLDIPASLKVFSYSFENSGLKSVNILDGVSTIDAYAFNKCSLQNITIPESVTTINGGAFAGCWDLYHIKLPQGVIVGSEAFKGSGLRSVQIPSGSTIGNQAFANCSHLETATLGSGIKSIGNFSFARCGSLNEIELPDSVSTIGDHAFYQCENLNEIVLPPGLQQIGSYAFAECCNLREIKIADGLESVGGYAFDGCVAVTNLVFPKTVQAMGVGLLRGCTNIVDITLPFVGATKDCKQDVDYDGSNEYLASTNILGWIFGWNVLSYPDTLTDKWISQGKEINVGEGIYRYAKKSLHYYIPENLKNIVVLDSAGRIGGNVFYGCRYLQSVTMPAAVTNIGDRAFYGCRNLKCLKFNGDAPVLGNNVFDGVQTSIYVHCGSMGWDDDEDGRWNGFKINNLPNLSQLYYSADGSECWHAYDSTYSWRAGAITNRETSILVGKVHGAGGISFRWKRQMQSSGKLAFFVDGVQQGDIITENIGWTDVAAEVLDDIDHTFEWRYLAARSGTLDTDTAWVDNIVWQANNEMPIRVEYVLNGKGSRTSGGDLVQYITRGTATTLPEIVPNEGWVFDGWTYTNKLVTSSTINVAKFTPIEYGIAYDLNGIVCDNSANPKTYNITNDVVFVSPTGYDTNRWLFEGWSQDGLSAGNVGDKIITAKWNSAAHSISIAGQSSVYGQFGDKVALECLTNVTNGLINIVCVGWNGTGCVPPVGASNCVEVVLSGDGTINWLYQTNVCLVASSDCGQVEPNCQWYNLADNELAEVCFVPNVGYQLYAWMIDGEIQDPVSGNLPLLLAMDSAHQVGVVTRRSATVNTNVVGSACAWNLVGPQTYRSGAIVNNQRTDMSIKIVGPAICSFEWAVSSENGYDYLYCHVDDDPSVAKITGVQDWTTVNVDVGDGSHTIRWSFKKDDMDEDPVGEDCGWVRNITIAGKDYQYAVKFNAGEHGTIPTAEMLQQVYWGGNASMPHVSVEDGWTFTGWNGFASNITANTELTATYICNDAPVFSSVSYTNLRGATHSNPTRYEEGVEIALTNPSDVLGYSFTGWTPDAIAAGMTGPLEISANWVANSYTIHYLPNGGCGEMPETPCSYDQFVTLSSNGFTRIRYEFKGWATNENGAVVYVNGQSVSNLTSRQNDVFSLYAVWDYVPITDAEVGKAITGLNDPVTVRSTWVTEFLTQRYGVDKEDSFREKFGERLADALIKATGKTDSRGRELTVWDDYVAGTDPTDPTSLFAAAIEIVDGNIVINWSPNLNEGTTNRLYRIKSKASLSDEWSCPPVEGHSFFTVEVGLPDGESITTAPGVVGKVAEPPRSDLYCVIDLSAGTETNSYPISYLSAVPTGSWSDEYKTTKLVLRRIEPGSFKMNDVYDVTLTNPYYMGVFEVTQKQYELVTGTKPSVFSGDKLPAERVSWNVIKDNFIVKLQQKTEHLFDLPTEAQWEYACRAGTTTEYSYGDDVDDDYMWYCSNSDCRTHDVGTRLPNNWGLYDMHGNVLEWCLDWVAELTSATNPTGPSTGTHKVFRGGHWEDFEYICRSSYRGGTDPSLSDYRFGFRIALLIQK